jgi:hypothetical protein
MSLLFRSQDESVLVLIGGREYLVARARLGKYLELEQYWLTKNVRTYLNAAGVTTTSKDSGVELLVAFAKIVLLNRLPEGVPILDVKTPPTSSIPWHYKGRKAFSYIHLIASAYGWSRSEILNLRVEEFFAYAQEILADKQLNSEELHRLSKMSYKYEKTTKSLTLVRLERPLWMMPDPKPIKRKPVPAQLAPVGNVVNSGSKSA